MASGSFPLDLYGGFTGNPWWEARCTWSSSPNASANTSYVTVNIQMRHIASETTESFTGEYTGFYNIWSGPEEKDIISTTNFSAVKTITTSWTTLKTFSFTAKHDSSGNCTLYPGVRVNGASGTGAASTSRTTAGNVSFSLGSTRQKASITSAPDFTDEDSPTVRYSNPMGSSVSALEMCIADVTGYDIIVPYRSVSKTSGSYTFNFTDSERSNLISAVGTGTSVSVRFYLRTTISGSTYLSYSTKTLTVEVGGPVITASIADVDPVTVALTGGGTKYIKGRNSMQFSMSATGQKGATITKYNVACGNRSSSSTSGTLTNIENDVVIFSATDSRGITATKTIQLQGINYVKLTCNQTVKMLLESETAAQIELNVNGNYFDGSFGAQNNTLKIYSRHSRNDGEMGDWAEITPLISDISNNTYTLHADMSGFDPSGTYYFQCKAVDALGEVITEEYPAQFIPVFDWSKNDFNFNVPVTIEGNPLNDYVIETGTEAMGTNGTWYWSKWKSGRAECYGCRNYGIMAVTTEWGPLYRSEVFTQSLPYGLFVEEPEVIEITFRNGSFGAWIAKHETSAPSNSDSGSFIVVRPASAKLSPSNISFNVIGRWK